MKKKWESGQKARKPLKTLGFLLAIFIFKSGQLAKKSGHKPVFSSPKISNGQIKVATGQIF